MQDVKKVVLAYSGGLDTSVILKWLIETYHCEVITCTADLGQPEDLSGVEEKALKTGASKAYVVDLREEMARDFVFPMMRGAARYENRYMLGTSIARPCITKALIDIARKEGLLLELDKEKLPNWQNLNPAFLGKQPRLILGKKSGMLSIGKKLELLGVTLDDDRKRALLGDVKALGIQKERALTDEEFLALLRNYQ